MTTLENKTKKKQTSSSNINQLKKYGRASVFFYTVMTLNETQIVRNANHRDLRFFLVLKVHRVMVEGFLQSQRNYLQKYSCSLRGKHAVKGLSV